MGTNPIPCQSSYLLGADHSCFCCRCISLRNGPPSFRALWQSCPLWGTRIRWRRCPVWERGLALSRCAYPNSNPATRAVRCSLVRSATATSGFCVSDHRLVMISSLAQLRLRLGRHCSHLPYACVLVALHRIRAAPRFLFRPVFLVQLLEARLRPIFVVAFVRPFFQLGVGFPQGMLYDVAHISCAVVGF